MCRSVQQLDAEELSASGFVDRSSQFVVTSARAIGLLDPAETPSINVTVLPATTVKPIKASIVNVDLDTEFAVLRPEAAFPAGTGIEPNRLGVRDSQKLFVCGPTTGDFKITQKIAASPENELVRFDRNDSIESGLPGAAIVNSDGKLVGVPVGPKQANAVPFAIPAERVAGLFNGQVESIEIGDAKQMGENRRVAVRVKVRDPFKKIKAVPTRGRIRSFAGNRAVAITRCIPPMEWG